MIKIRTSCYEIFYFSVLNLQNRPDRSQKKKDVQNANPELHRDGICRDRPTVTLWQQQFSDPPVLAVITSLNSSSKFTRTSEQREAAPRHLRYRRSGANVQINDSVGRRAASQSGHSPATRAALGPRVSTRCLPDEHFLDLLHQRCATAASE